MQKDNNFHKIGLFGTTIKDASNKIKKLSDIIEWLEDMDNLYKNGSKKHWWGTDTSSEKGMKCLHDSITKNKLTDVKEDSFSSLLDLVVILQDISIGSLKAWRGRTKQPGFQKTLQQCKATIIEKLANFPSENTKSIKEIDIVTSMNQLLQNNIRILLDEIFKLTDPEPAAKIKQNIVHDLKYKWYDLKKKTSLEIASINKIIRAYTKAFSLDKNDVKDLKNTLLLTNTNFNFLDLDDKFKGTNNLENIISWMFNLYSKTNEILEKAKELKENGDLPEIESDPTSCKMVYDKVNKCKSINSKLKDIENIQYEFNKANKKSYLKYLWSVHAILEDLENRKLESTKKLLDFTSSESKKIWETIIGKQQNELSKAIILVICDKLNINKYGKPKDFFRYEDLAKIYEKEFTTEMKEKLEANKALLQADELSQGLIKKFNENYDKEPLIKIDQLIKK